jgi:hypothetical protein
MMLAGQTNPKHGSTGSPAGMWRSALAGLGNQVGTLVQSRVDGRAGQQGEIRPSSGLIQTFGNVFVDGFEPVPPR